MRQKRENVYFTFLYPGFKTGGPKPPEDAACVAIPHSGEWVSINGEKYGGEQPSAVFYDPRTLRELAEVLDEAADLLEANRAKAQRDERLDAAPTAAPDGEGDIFDVAIQSLHDRYPDDGAPAQPGEPPFEDGMPF